MDTEAGQMDHGICDDSLSLQQPTIYLHGPELYCGWCLLAFTCPTRLKIHFNIEHQLTCSCGRAFADKSSLIMHINLGVCFLPHPFQWHHFMKDSSPISEDEDNDVEESSYDLEKSSVRSESDTCGLVSESHEVSDLERLSAETTDGTKMSSSFRKCLPEIASSKGQNNCNSVKLPSAVNSFSCEKCRRVYATALSFNGHLARCRRKLIKIDSMITYYDGQLHCSICSRSFLNKNKKVALQHLRIEHASELLKRGIKPMKFKSLLPNAVKDLTEPSISSTPVDIVCPLLAEPAQPVALLGSGLDSHVIDGSSSTSFQDLQENVEASAAANADAAFLSEDTRCIYCGKWFSTTSCCLIHQRICKGRGSGQAEMAFLRGCFITQKGGALHCRFCQRSYNRWHPALLHIRVNHRSALKTWQDSHKRNSLINTDLKKLSTKQSSSFLSTGNVIEQSELAEMADVDGSFRSKPEPSFVPVENNLLSDDGSLKPPLSVPYTKIITGEQLTGLENSIEDVKPCSMVTIKDGERRFSCPYCDVVLRSATSYYRHRKQCMETGSSGIALADSECNSVKTDLSMSDSSIVVPQIASLGNDTECRNQNSVKTNVKRRAAKFGIKVRYYRCPYCGIKYRSKSSYYKHRKCCSHRGLQDNVNSLPVVKQEFGNEKCCMKSNKGYLCQFCKRSFNSRSNCHRHEALCRFTSVHTEVIPGVDEKSASEKEMHLRAENLQSNHAYPCPECSSVFRMLKGLKRHCDQVHQRSLVNPNSPPTADGCPLPDMKTAAGTPSKGTVQRSSHSLNFKRYCSRCHRSFLSYITFKQHRATCRHVERKADKEELAHLDSHFLICSNGRFQCSVCESSQKYISDIRRHVRQKHGDLLFQCSAKSPSKVSHGSDHCDDIKESNMENLIAVKQEIDARTCETDTEGGTTCTRKFCARCHQAMMSPIKCRYCTACDKQLKYVNSSYEMLAEDKIRCLICGVLHCNKRNARRHVINIHGIPDDWTSGTSSPLKNSRVTPDDTSASNSTLSENVVPKTDSPESREAKVHTCSNCNRRCLSGTGLASHMKTCCLSPKRSRRESEFYEFLVGGRVQCLVCKITFCTRASALRHIRKKHKKLYRSATKKVEAPHVADELAVDTVLAQ